MMEKRGRKYIKIVLKVLIIIFALAIIYGLYFFYVTYIHVKACSDDECFLNALRSCERIRYIKNTPETIWKYNIIGISGGRCMVYVKLLGLKEGGLDLESLIGKDMICSLHPWIVGMPEKEIDNCHGELKEEIQKIIINRMHSYIIENIGQISKDILGII